MSSSQQGGGGGGRLMSGAIWSAVVVIAVIFGLTQLGDLWSDLPFNLVGMAIDGVELLVAIGFTVLGYKQVAKAVRGPNNQRRLPR